MSPVRNALRTAPTAVISESAQAAPAAPPTDAVAAASALAPVASTDARTSVEPVLRVADLTIRNRTTGIDVVSGVSFALRRGRVLGIVGESGSGKTLTCRAILGILPTLFDISSGSVDLLGRDISTLTPGEWTTLRGTSITAVFQDPGSYLNPAIRIGAQIAEVIRVKLRVGRRGARERALGLLADVRLRDPELVYRQFPHELSGGMLQRVLIAAAVALDPQILIADEVTTALDVTVQAEILDLLLDLKESRGLSLVVISHDLAVVAQTCDEVLVLRRGQIVEFGPTDRILYDPADEYTRLLIDEHNNYGLDRFLDSDRAGASASIDAALNALRREEADRVR